MDAEIVAIDSTSGELKSFQELSNRARKDVNIKDIRVAVCIYAFDLMLLNGEVRNLWTFDDFFKKYLDSLYLSIASVNVEIYFESAFGPLEDQIPKR